MKKIVFMFVMMMSSLTSFAQSFITEIGQTVYDLQTNATIGARVLAE